MHVCMISSITNFLHIRQVHAHMFISIYKTISNTEIPNFHTGIFFHFEVSVAISQPTSGHFSSYTKKSSMSLQTYFLSLLALADTFINTYILGIPTAKHNQKSTVQEHKISRKSGVMTTSQKILFAKVLKIPMCVSYSFSCLRQTLARFTSQYELGISSACPLNLTHTSKAFPCFFPLRI